MRYASLIVAYLISLNGFSQDHPDIPFEHIPIPGTIRSSQVNEIIQDHHGLIWASGDGLYRYDGYKFTAYKNISPDLSIGGKEINCILADKNSNKLFLGTHSHGLVEYDYTTDNFRVIPSKGGIPIIALISQTSDGTVWVGSFSNGLYYLKNDTLRKLEKPQNKYSYSTSLMTIGNKLWVNKQKAIYILENGELIDSIKIAFEDFDFSSTTRATTMTPDRAGRIWIGTERAGVLVYDTLKKVFVKHFAPDKGPFYHRINKIMVDNKDNVWILTKANGIAVYVPAKDEYIHITKNSLFEHTLSGNNCTSIIQDNSNIIWVGSTGDLNKYDPSKIKFRHIYSSPFNSISLNDNMVRGIFEDTREKLWVGTDGGVIHIIDRQKSTFEKISITVGGSKQPIVPVHFLELSDNIMLVATPVGLLQFDRRKKAFEYFQPLAKILNGRQVRQLLLSNDELWLIHSGAVVSYNFKTKTIREFKEFAQGIKNATAIYFDSQQRLWIGAMNGVSLYNPEANTFRHYLFEKDSKRPTGTYFMVLSIFEHQQKLWIGTFNSGLWSMDLTNLENPKIVNITEKQGLPNNTVYSTLPDEKGNLWLSTNQGISKYEIHSSQFLNFGLSDGIQHEEFNRLAYHKCKNGEIVFGGINGLNIFDPKSIVIEETLHSPKPLGLVVFQEGEPKSQYYGLIDQNAITLKHKQNSFAFNFFIPNYRSPKRYEVYYKLTSYDPAWIKAESNTIQYSNLRSGDYALMIKSVSASGAEKLISFQVSIEYPFWQTWWFIVLAVGLVSFIVFSLIQASVRKAKKDKARLEKLLSERTQEIEKSREELANLNQKKDVIFSILSHDLRSPLTTLKGFLSILIDNSDHLSKEEIKKHAGNIRNSVTSSLDLIDNTLFWSLSQTGNITYTPTSFSLNEMLQKISNLYQLMAEKKKINLSIESREKVLLYGDENMIYVALRNLVSNALKFTPEGKAIRIITNCNHQFAEINIQDEGIGMSAAYIDKLLHEEHHQLKVGTSNEKGTGLGIVLCKKFIHMNNGELHVTSVEGKGTDFIVSLPLAKNEKELDATN